MKITIMVLPFCLILVGCDKAAVKTESAAKDLPSFKEGKGLLLSAETRKCIGLDIVEVTERKLVPEFTTDVQVYRTKDDMLLASGFINADQASQLTIGQTATLKTREKNSLAGKLVRLDEQTKQATGQVEALLEISARAQDNPIGTFFTATFTGGKEATVVVIPRSALLRAAEGDFVFVVNGSDLRRTAVKVGAERDDVMEITDGLYSGDRVASKAVQNLWLTELRFVKGGAGCCAK